MSRIWRLSQTHVGNMCKVITYPERAIITGHIMSQRTTKPIIRLLRPAKTPSSTAKSYPKRDEQTLPYWVDVQAGLSL